MKIVVAVTAASGALYARLCLEQLLRAEEVSEIALVYSAHAREVADFEGVTTARRSSHPHFSQRRFVRSSGQRFGRLRRDGGRSLFGRNPGTHRLRHFAKLDRTGCGRDAQGAPPPGAGRAGDAPLADSPAQYDRSYRSRRRRVARFPRILRPPLVHRGVVPVGDRAGHGSFRYFRTALPMDRRGTIGGTKRFGFGKISRRCRFTQIFRNFASAKNRK